MFACRICFNFSHTFLRMCILKLGGLQYIRDSCLYYKYIYKHIFRKDHFAKVLWWVQTNESEYFHQAEGRGSSMNFLFIAILTRSFWNKIHIFPLQLGKHICLSPLTFGHWFTVSSIRHPRSHVRPDDREKWAVLNWF